ncbi:hypothetical protein J6590_022788 [Homalodisca vitripennis]|nr:hypothetical protein J6590_022788 [Homalodisca vitripennis]
MSLITPAPDLTHRSGCDVISCLVTGSVTLRNPPKSRLRGVAYIREQIDGFTLYDIEAGSTV